MLLAASASANTSASANATANGTLPNSTRYITRNWEVRDGLPAVTVTDIAQDADGFLWVSTLGGVARFDGREFLPVRSSVLESDGYRVFSLAVEGEWVYATTTAGNLVRIHRRRAEVEAVFHPAENRRNAFLRVVTDDSGALHLLGNGVWRRGRENVWTSVVAKTDAWVRDVFFRPDGTLWVLSEAQLFCAKGDCPPSHRIERQEILSAAATPEGFWLTTDRGLEHAIGIGAQDIHIPRLPIPMPAMVTTSKDNRLFVATTKDLVTLDVHPTGEGFAANIPLTFHHPTIPNLKGPLGRVFFEDRDQNLWLGSGDLGLFLVHDRQVEHVGPPHGLEGRSALSMLPTSDGALLSLYCVGLQHLSIDRNGEATVQRVRGGGLHDETCVKAMVAGRDGDALVSAGEDILRIGPHQKNVQKVFDGDRPGMSPINAFHPTASGALWAATEDHGLLLFSPNDAPNDAPDGADGAPDDDQRGPPLVPSSRLALNGEGTPAAAPVLANAYRVVRRVPLANSPWPIVSTFVDEDQRMWLATSKGLRIFDGHTISLPDAEVAQRKIPVRHITQDTDGTIWASSYGGGLLYLPAQGEPRWLRQDTGFCADFISHMRTTHEGGHHRVWFNSNGGVFWVPAAELLAHAQTRAPLRCRFLDTGEGNGGVMPSGAQLANGDLLFPTVNGPVLVDPSEIEETAVDIPTKPFVQQALVGGRPVPLAGSATFAPDHRDFMVEVLFPKFDAPRPPRFEVRIERNGTLATTAVGGTRHHFEQLAPGEYSVAIRHLSADGAKSAPRWLHFVLEPVWHERTLIRVGLPAGLLLLLGSLMYFWVSILRTRARLLSAKLVEREAKEVARLERDALYRAAFERSKMALMVFDSSGQIADVNRAGRIYTEASDDDSAGVLRLQNDAERARFVRCIAALAASGSDTSGATAAKDREFVLETESGPKTVQVAAVPFTLKGAERLLVTFIDLTFEREAEEERMRLARRTEATKRLEGLGRISAGIAHDFNNVLAALALQVHMLPKATEAEREIVNDMRESIDLGRALTARLLTGKGRADAPPLSVDAAVATMVSSPVQLRCAAAGKMASVTEIELRQVVQNLVDNAIHASESPAAIVVETQVTERPEALAGFRSRYGEGVVVHAFPDGPCVTLSVTDDGIGIEAPLIASIFEPFFSRKVAKGGTGIGLTTVLEIVRARGAGLCVYSRPGAGSAFVVGFPVANARPPQKSPSPRQASLFREQTTEDSPAVQFPPPAPVILVCDDQETIRRGISLALTNAGAKVELAADGQEALDILAARDFAVDLIVTDYRMPNVDGLELIRRARERSKTLPILLLSGFLGDAEVLEQLPADAYRLQKPVDPFALVVEVRAILAAQSSAAQNEVG